MCPRLACFQRVMTLLYHLLGIGIKLWTMSYHVWCTLPLPRSPCLNIEAFWTASEACSRPAALLPCHLCLLLKSRVQVLTSSFQYRCRHSAHSAESFPLEVPRGWKTPCFALYLREGTLESLSEKVVLFGILKLYSYYVHLKKSSLGCVCVCMHVRASSRIHTHIGISRLWMKMATPL